MALLLLCILLLGCWLLYLVLTAHTLRARLLACCLLASLICTPVFFIAMNTPLALWALLLGVSCASLVLLADTKTHKATQQKSS